MSKTKSRDQVQMVIAEMRDVRSSRSAALRKMLNENERLTRETVSAELEVKNYKAAQKRLKEEISRLQKDLKQAKAAHAKTVGAAKEARTESAALARQGVSLNGSVKKLQSDVNKLKSANGKLERRVNGLDNVRGKLSADVKRLKDLRTKYLSELAKYKVG